MCTYYLVFSIQASMPQVTHRLRQTAVREPRHMDIIAMSDSIHLCHLPRLLLQAWLEAGLECEKGDVRVASTRRSKGMVVSSRGCLGAGDWKLSLSGFQAHLQPALYRTARQVLGVMEGSAPGAIVDVRPPERFHGLQAEPPLPDGLPEPARGHIPTSINLPWQSVVSAENSQHFLAAPQLSEVFRKAGVDVASDQPVVTTCSSGITAAMVSFALHLCGRDPALNPVFDGSWAEWATSSDFPIVPAASQARPPRSSRTDNAQ
eukprot:TRINITY_DN3286_c0_g1_i2.p1 TRINITY_DN3286_c0_g1~~TRINITY_DN3286_c0_g1_i2.p1  ORF type:complete len:262 (-),score=50.97 TRINITY_DN3286_c0_g1_i2:545-1330(-)